MGNNCSKTYVHQLNESAQRPRRRNLNKNVSFLAPLIDLLTTVNTISPSTLSPPTLGELRFRASAGPASPGCSATSQVRQMAATPGQAVVSYALANALVKPFEGIESIWIKNSRYHREHVSQPRAQLVAYYADQCRLNGLVYEKDCEKGRLREEDEEDEDEESEEDREVQAILSNPVPKPEPELPEVERIAIDLLTERIGYRNKFGDKFGHK